jgi:hypothetical protein
MCGFADQGMNTDPYPSIFKRNLTNNQWPLFQKKEGEHRGVAF